MYGLFPVLEVLVYLTTLDESLCVVRNHFEAKIKLLKSLLITTQLYVADGRVQADRRVECQV